MSSGVSNVVHFPNAPPDVGFGEIQDFEGPAWPLYSFQPHPPHTNKRALAPVEPTRFGPLIAFVSPAETLNIEQLFYLMRQNFMAASIKLCQPSVLW